MRLKILMMLKNEDDLISPWLSFHGDLVGYENLYIFDNGSDSAAVKVALQQASEKGAHVDLSLDKAEHFLGKGEIFSSLIQHLDANDPADFYFPLDCDEFLGADRGAQGIRFDRQALEDALAPFVGFKGALAIKAGWDNNPRQPDEFFESTAQRKTFFATDACAFLDHGFHVGVGKLPGDAVRTPIVYVHYHFKPFSLLQSHARQKLAHFTDDFSREGLLRYGEAQKPNFHVIGHLLAEEDTYYSAISSREHARLGNFVDRFADLGVPLPFTR